MEFLLGNHRRNVVEKTTVDQKEIEPERPIFTKCLFFSVPAFRWDTLRARVVVVVGGISVGAEGITAVALKGQ